MRGLRVDTAVRWGPLYNGGSAPAPFTPASLFPGTGAWYDPSDISTLFQDTGGATPVTASGQPVGRINDKSGNGNHWLQGTAAARPIYTVSGGIHYLLCDGVDDGLSVTLAGIGAQPMEVSMGVRLLVAPGNAHLLSGPAIGYTGGNLYIYAGSAVVNPGTTLAIAADAVVNARANGASSRINIDGLTYGTGNPGAANPGTIVLAGNGGTNLHFHGLTVVGRDMTAAEIASLLTYYAAKQGRVL